EEGLGLHQEEQAPGRREPAHDQCRRQAEGRPRQGEGHDVRDDQAHLESPEVDRRFRSRPARAGFRARRPLSLEDRKMTPYRLARWLLPALLALLAGCGTVRNTIVEGD